jgi:hypothetical protein
MDPITIPTIAPLDIDENGLLAEIEVDTAVEEEIVGSNALPEDTVPATSVFAAEVVVVVATGPS